MNRLSCLIASLVFCSCTPSVARHQDPIVAIAPTSAASVQLPLLAPDDPFRSKAPSADPDPLVYLPVIEESVRPNGVRVLVVKMTSWYFGSVELVSKVGESAVLDRPAGIRLATLGAAWHSAGGVSTRDRLSALASLFAEYSFKIDSDGESHILLVGGKGLPDATAHLFDVANHPDFLSQNMAFVKGRLLARYETSRNEVPTISWTNFCKATFGSQHPECRPVHMRPADISQLSEETLHAANGVLFQPANLTVIAAGDFDRERLFSVVDNAIKDLPKQPANKTKTQAKAKTLVIPPVQPSQARIVVVDRPGSGQASLSYGYAVAPRPHAEISALGVAHQLMVGSAGGILNSAMTNDLIVSWYAQGFNSWSKWGCLSRWESAVDAQAVDTVIREILRTVRRVLAGPIDPQQLEGAKNRSFSNRASSYESATSIVSLLRQYVQYDVSPNELSDSLRRIPNITGEQVQAALRTWFDPDKARIVIVGDFSKLKAPLSRLDMGPIEIRDNDGEILRVETLSSH